MSLSRIPFYLGLGYGLVVGCVGIIFLMSSLDKQNPPGWVATFELTPTKDNLVGAVTLLPHTETHTVVSGEEGGLM